MSKQPAIDEVIVVLIGGLSPVVFTPDWLLRHGLIGEDEHAGATVEVVHPSVTTLQIGWLTLQATERRLRLGTTDPASAPLLRDFCVGVLGVLESTPIVQCGLNRILHFATESEQAWHTIGHRLVPKSPFEDLMDHPGTRSVSIEGLRPGATARYTRVTISPSQLVQHAVAMDFNEHYQDDSATDSRFARDVITNAFDEATRYFLESARTLLQRVGEPR